MMLVATSHHSKIDCRGQDEPQNVYSLHRDAGMKHPGVNQGRQRQEYKAQNQKDEIIVVGPIQIPAEEEEQGQCDSRKQQDQDEQAARHQPSIVRLLL